MHPEKFVYNLYEVHSAQPEPVMLLVRVTRPAHSADSTAAMSQARQQENEQRTRLLCDYQRAHCHSHGQSCSLVLVGVSEGEQPGAVVQKGSNGAMDRLWLESTRHRYPWLVLGTASTQGDRARGEDETPLYATYHPEPPAQHVTTHFMSAEIVKGAPFVV